MTPKSEAHAHARHAPVPLTDLKRGHGGRVIRVIATDRDDFKKFAAMGIFPGVRIKLVQKTPSYLFQVGHSQFAVDKELAAKIEVELIN